MSKKQELIFIVHRITCIYRLCVLTELEQEGKKLFYRKDGRRIEIKRIYNRIIFDELGQQT